jgi:hypothetical protein
MECKLLLKMDSTLKKVDSEHAGNCNPAAVHASLTLPQQAENNRGTALDGQLDGVGVVMTAIPRYAACSALGTNRLSSLWFC